VINFTAVILHKELLVVAEFNVLCLKNSSLIFGRKIFRRIYGAKYENGDWKSRTNRELEEMSKGENIIK